MQSTGGSIAAAAAHLSSEQDALRSAKDREAVINAANQYEAVMNLARERAQNSISQIDQELFYKNPTLNTAYYEEALAIAQKQGSARLENHGKIDIGGGVFMTQSEVDSIAERNVRPVLLEISEKATAQRQADEERRIAEEEDRKRRAEEKRLEQEKKANERRQANEQKAAEKAIRDEELAKQRAAQQKIRAEERERRDIERKKQAEDRQAQRVIVDKQRAEDRARKAEDRRKSKVEKQTLTEQRRREKHALKLAAFATATAAAGAKEAELLAQREVQRTKALKDQAEAKLEAAKIAESHAASTAQSDQARLATTQAEAELAAATAKVRDAELQKAKAEAEKAKADNEVHNAVSAQKQLDQKYREDAALVAQLESGALHPVTDAVEAEEDEDEDDTVERLEAEEDAIEAELDEDAAKILRDAEEAVETEGINGSSAPVTRGGISDVDSDLEARTIEGNKDDTPATATATPATPAAATTKPKSNVDVDASPIHDEPVAPSRTVASESSFATAETNDSSEPAKLSSIAPVVIPGTAAAAVAATAAATTPAGKAEPTTTAATTTTPAQEKGLDKKASVATFSSTKSGTIAPSKTVASESVSAAPVVSITPSSVYPEVSLPSVAPAASIASSKVPADEATLKTDASVKSAAIDTPKPLTSIPDINTKQVKSVSPTATPPSTSPSIASPAVTPFITANTVAPTTTNASTATSSKSKNFFSRVKQYTSEKPSELYKKTRNSISGSSGRRSSILGRKNNTSTNASATANGTRRDSRDPTEMAHAIMATAASKGPHTSGTAGSVPLTTTTTAASLNNTRSIPAAQVTIPAAATPAATVSVANSDDELPTNAAVTKPSGTTTTPAATGTATATATPAAAAAKAAIVNTKPVPPASPSATDKDSKSPEFKKSHQRTFSGFSQGGKEEEEEIPGSLPKIKKEEEEALTAAAITKEEENEDDEDDEEAIKIVKKVNDEDDRTSTLKSAIKNGADKAIEENEKKQSLSKVDDDDGKYTSVFKEDLK